MHKHDGDLKLECDVFDYMGLAPKNSARVLHRNKLYNHDFNKSSYGEEKLAVIRYIAQNR